MVEPFHKSNKIQHSRQQAAECFTCPCEWYGKADVLTHGVPPLFMRTCIGGPQTPAMASFICLPPTIIKRCRALHHHSVHISHWHKSRHISSPKYGGLVRDGQYTVESRDTYRS